LIYDISCSFGHNTILWIKQKMPADTFIGEQIPV